MAHKSPTLFPNLDFVTIVSDASNSPSSVCNLCTSLSWLHQNGAEKHSLVMEIPIGATVITIGDHGEGLQVLHYEEGQKYEPHYDYFVDEFNTKNGGQRMATMLMYLTDVEEGGETPRMGDALLFWSMRPDAMLDPSSLHEGTSGHLPDFRPTVDNKPPSKGKNRTGIIVGVIVGLGLLSILAGVELLSMEIKPFTFTYSELKSATQDFNLSNKLEEGGFEPVYKGESVQALGYSLSVYAWIDQDVGYCQGMSDLCSPMIVLLEDEADSFFCFERLMRRLRGNFRSTGRSVGVEAQLTHLSSITQIIDPKLHQHLEGTLTRRFWRVNTRVVVKVTLAARILTLSVTVERREEVSKSDKKSRPSNQCGSKEVRNKHDEQRTGGKKRYDSDATEP
ncbi:hypothetical protein YC2023_032636 [Brassica napus]